MLLPGELALVDCGEEFEALAPPKEYIDAENGGDVEEEEEDGAGVVRCCCLVDCGCIRYVRALTNGSLDNEKKFEGVKFNNFDPFRACLCSCDCNTNQLCGREED